MKIERYLIIKELPADIDAAESFNKRHPVGSIINFPEPKTDKKGNEEYRKQYYRRIDANKNS